MSNNNAFPFGTPASTGASDGKLFGSASGGATATSGGVFGNIGASTGTSLPSIFGTVSQASDQQKSIFGGAGGAASSTPTFSFGPGSQTSSATGLSLFGTQTPNKTTETPASTQTMPLFGNTMKPASSPFGNNITTTTPSGGSSLFGSSSFTPVGPPPAGSSGTQASSLFGAQNLQTTFSGVTTTQSSTSSTMVTTIAQPATSSQPTSSGSLFTAGSARAPLFGSSPSTTTGGLFASMNKDQQTSSNQAPNVASGEPLKSLFGSAPVNPAQASSSPFKFSSNPDSQSPSKVLFPSTTSVAATQPSPFPTSSATPQKALFSFGSATSSTTPSATPATLSAGNSLAAGFGVSKTGSEAGTGITSSTTPAAAPSTSISSGGSLFTLTKSATSTTTTSGPGSASTVVPAKKDEVDAAKKASMAAPTPGMANLAASTAGPAPPAQSRLKNKTMDEIITRWATDLTKYQKEFREQAEKVAEWDRMLVENTAKVQKLFGNTIDAERATQEVERQLVSVEGQQEELGSWLDRYEREVEEMISKQVGPGESLQGPDQERERTYKLAERLSERLDEVGKDLTSMIEEVNSASTTLSKSNKADEPISQIVRILNSHLSQLQLIDVGTSELQAKVSAAQKASQSLGSRLGGYSTGGVAHAPYQTQPHNGNGSGNAVDDFYRSYMGRR